tara:strand:- start:1772 stop:2194 length:423 start_codon:yes stop_codon:yes gene_type:complete
MPRKLNLGPDGLGQGIGWHVGHVSDLGLELLRRGFIVRWIWKPKHVRKLFGRSHWRWLTGISGGGASPDIHRQPKTPGYRSLRIGPLSITRLHSRRALAAMLLRLSSLVEYQNRENERLRREKQTAETTVSVMAASRRLY